MSMSRGRSQIGLMWETVKWANKRVKTRAKALLKKHNTQLLCSVPTWDSESGPGVHIHLSPSKCVPVDRSSVPQVLPASHSDVKHWVFRWPYPSNKQYQKQVSKVRRRPVPLNWPIIRLKVIIDMCKVFPILKLKKKRKVMKRNLIVHFVKDIWSFF
jgi:hypothetical protein